MIYDSEMTLDTCRCIQTKVLLDLHMPTEHVFLLAVLTKKAWRFSDGFSRTGGYEGLSILTTRQKSAFSKRLTPNAYHKIYHQDQVLVSNTMGGST